MRETLDEIGVKHSTDKSSLHHHYLEFYERLFRQCRYTGPRILEIGVQFGNSLRTWKEYFCEATITGIDSVDNGPSSKVEGTRILIGDAYTEEMIANVDRWNWDIMIDDGSHALANQVWFVQCYSRLLSEYGILIVEDVLTKVNALALKRAAPAGFSPCIVEMTEGDSIVDSRLFLMWRK
jgi:hypothetical protein